jgi:hypothetical protein
VAKLTKMPSDAAAGLRVSERLLLFCIASTTDHHRAGITHEIVTSAMVKGFIDRNGAGDLALTDSGRAVLRAMLPDL